MTVRDPLYMNAVAGQPDYSAADARLGQSALLAPGYRDLSARSGVVPAVGGMLAGSVDGATPGTWTVETGQAWVDAVLSVGSYLLTVDAAEAGNIAAAGTVERIDRVIIRARDGEVDSDVGTDRTGTVEYLQGDSSTGAGEPLPAHALLLMEITVPTAGTPSAQDKRTYQARAGMPLWVKDAAERDLLPDIPGLMVHRLDTGDSQQYDGANWLTTSSGWRDFSPTTYHNPTGSSVAVFGTGRTIERARYRRVGNRVDAYVYINYTGAGSAKSMQVSLPVPMPTRLFNLGTCAILGASASPDQMGIAYGTAEGNVAAIAFNRAYHDAPTSSAFTYNVSYEVE